MIVALATTQHEQATKTTRAPLTEIIPPDHSERGTERVRVYIAKPSPLGLILLTLIIGFLSAAALVVLLGLSYFCCR